jgi:hypothetical protein
MKNNRLVEGHFYQNLFTYATFQLLEIGKNYCICQTGDGEKARIDLDDLKDSGRIKYIGGCDEKQGL